jgi:hypothetical protein
MSKESTERELGGTDSRLSALRCALIECHTSGGALAWHSRANAERRLHCINEVVSKALARDDGISERTPL